MNSKTIILLVLTIALSLFQLGESFLYSNKIQNMQARSKRHLSIAATDVLADRLYKERLNQAKEKVGDRYIKPESPYSYGKK
uniref:Uncharacterized protein n=1 Tax=Strongyloides stercoralis TaxID=6248 RepID=A0A0K0EA25_STRER